MTLIFRYIWSSLIWLALILIPVQFYLAGHGAFEFHNASSSARESAWGVHAALGSIIGVIVLLTLIASLIARLPKRLLIMTSALFVFMLIQFALPGFGDSSSTRWIAALHAINALIVTGLLVMLAIRSLPFVPIARFRAGTSRTATAEPNGPDSVDRIRQD